MKFRKIRPYLGLPFLLISIIWHQLQPDFIKFREVKTLSGSNVENPCKEKSRCLVMSLATLQSCCSCPGAKNFLEGISTGALRKNIGVAIIFTDSLGLKELRTLSPQVQINSYAGQLSSVYTGRFSTPTRALWVIDENRRVLSEIADIPSEFNQQTRETLKSKLGLEYANIFH